METSYLGTHILTAAHVAFDFLDPNYFKQQEGISSVTTFNIHNYFGTYSKNDGANDYIMDYAFVPCRDEFSYHTSLSSNEYL